MWSRIPREVVYETRLRDLEAQALRLADSEAGRVRLLLRTNRERDSLASARYRNARKGRNDYTVLGSWRRKQEALPMRVEESVEINAPLQEVYGSSRGWTYP